MKIINHSKNDNHKVLSIILLGFLLFGLKEFVELVYHPLQSAVALIGLLLIFSTAFFYNFKRVIPLKGSIKILFYAYLVWIILIIGRPLLFGISYTNESIHPYANYGLTSYLLPLIVLIGIKVITLPHLFRIIFLFSIIGFVFFVFNFNNMQAVVFRGQVATIEDEMGLAELADMYYFWFSISSFSLLCYEFVSTKYKWFAIITATFTMFLMIYLARRGGIFIYGLYFSGMFYLSLEQTKSDKRFFKVIFFVALIYIIYQIVISYAGSTFSILFDRLDDDTRSSVDNALIKYLNRENAWWFGNGIDATYKHPEFAKPRYLHETGLLHLVLKGGIVYLLFYVFLLLHCAYIGFFKTNNRLTKALAFYALFHVIFLIPYGIPSFSLEYLFVWIAFAICESTYYRTMSNQQIKEYLAQN